jgi:hypothetical protein
VGKWVLLKKKKGKFFCPEGHDPSDW